MTGKVTVIAYHRAKPGKEQGLREALLQVCGPTRAEKGCINYDRPTYCPMTWGSSCSMRRKS